MESTRKTGVVKFFNETKGYGFIVSKESSEEIFVHATGLTTKKPLIVMDDVVEYDEAEGKKGLMAVNVDRVTKTELV